MRILTTLFTIFLFQFNYAQEFRAVEHVEGQFWSSETKNKFDRLPARVEGIVSDAVWNLSKQSAGMMSRFRTNASEIIVRYHVGNDNYSLNHMPATGKSGVDLYTIGSDGEEKWCAARRTFGDTIEYRYLNLNPNDRYHKKGREYRLYFPLYNSVDWMEVGVDAKNYFDYLPNRPEKPILVYGTSIAQGACASRPGMAWTAQLSRKMDRPLINLAFSGNGMLVPPILELMTEVEAKVYVLDCLPNLLERRWESIGVKDSLGFIKHIVKAVKILKEKRPETPILLVEHAGYTEEFVSSKRKEDYAQLNRLQKQAYIDLRTEGYDGIYYLSKEELGLSLDAMVDGVHPNDLGMLEYAKAYEYKLREVLQEATGESSTTHPITQYREPDNYDWEKRHLEILALNKSDPPKQVFIANSIIHFWGGRPSAKLVRGGDDWDSVLNPAGVRNMAYGWDRIENAIWRVYHGELDGISPERIMIMIGTNNIHINSDSEIIEGLDLLIDAIKYRQADAELVLMGLLPRRNYVERINLLNMEIARLANSKKIKYEYLGEGLLNEKGELSENLFSDGLHPNAAGYKVILKQLRRLVE